MFRYILLAFVLAGFPCKIYSQSDEIYFLAKGHGERSSVREFFGSMTVEELNAYSFHHNSRIALPAAWVLANRKGKVNPEDASGLKREFLGFVAGRLRLPIPEWWRESVLESPMLYDEYLFDPTKAMKAFGSQQSPDGVIHGPEIEDLVVEKNHVGFIFRQQSINCFPSEDFLDGDKPNFVTCKILPDGRRFVFLSKNGRGQLFAQFLDEEKFVLKDLWTSDVAHGRENFISVKAIPPWGGVATLSTNEDSIIVFGVHQLGAYIDSYDIDTGEFQFGFSTNILID